MDRIKNHKLKTGRSINMAVLKLIVPIAIILISFGVIDYVGKQNINQAKSDAYKAGYTAGFNSGYKACDILSD